MSKITEIATIVANEAAKKKNPLGDLKWCRDYSFSHRFRTTQDENVQIYFAAVNILKNAGHSLKIFRKPLSNLTAKEKAWMRKKAKWLAAQMTPLIYGATVEVVPLVPIKGNGNNAEIQLAVGKEGSYSLIGCKLDFLKKLVAMPVLQQRITIQKIAERYKSHEQKMSESIELFRAALEE